MKTIGKKSKRSWKLSYRKLPNDGRSKHPLYRRYASMKNRCYNKNDIENYSLYGGRGIEVCERWLGAEGFNHFVADMGDCPEGFTLERIDVNGNYEPGNCKWASVLDQTWNRRNTMLFEGKKVNEIASDTGKHPESIRRSIRKGRSPYKKIDPWNKNTWEHGTYSGYTNHKCRCDDCRNARNARRKEKGW